MSLVLPKINSVKGVVRGGTEMWLETSCKGRRMHFGDHVSLRRQSARIPTELVLWERI